RRSRLYYGGSSRRALVRAPPVVADYLHHARTMSRLVDPIGPHDHVLGPENARASLVEYGDYECPYCGRAYRAVGETLRRVGRIVRFAYRHFPLTGIHPNAAVAACAAEAAAAQDQFWRMHALLFENQGALEPDDLLSYAEAIALDVVRF